MKPNFFIIGAPKCGTTALSSYLSDHKHIFMSSPKEPHFFADDFPHYKKNLPDLKAYEELFDASGEKGAVAVGEASVWYLYSEVAAKNIREYSSKAKLIIMLRKPTQVVQSLHKQLLWTLDEDEKDLEIALKKMYQRKKGQNLPNKCREPKFLQYLDVVKFGSQLEKIYWVFPKSQVEVVFFEDFVNDTSTSYKKILAFLNVEDDERRVFEKVNERKENKSNALAMFTHRPPKTLVLLIHWLKSTFGIKKFGILERIRKINSQSIARNDSTFSFPSEFIAELNSEIQKLEKLTGRNLSHWKEKSSSEECV